jgi:hypothetical protein
MRSAVISRESGVKNNTTPPPPPLRRAAITGLPELHRVNQEIHLVALNFSAQAIEEGHLESPPWLCRCPASSDLDEHAFDRKVIS